MKEKVTIITTVKSLPIILGLGLACGIQPAAALTFSLPAEGDLVGEIQTTTVRRGESLGDIGRRFDMGVYELIEANPKLDPWVPTVGSVVVIPSQFVLPKVPRRGIVLNLAEMRIYYFHPDKKQVTTYPIGTGKKGWATPLGETVITNKTKDPAWYPPDSIRKEHLDRGDILPPVVPGGPDNPLGRYAFYFSPKGLTIKGSYMLHGTNRPGGIGLRSTHGCIRLFPEDIESLYYNVAIGTPVRIIHEPFKVGWHKGRLYLEAHQPLSEPKYASSNSLNRLSQLIKASISGSYMVNWTSAKMAAETANGYPVRID